MRHTVDFDDSDRFVNFRDVPIFVEHETKARDGRLLRFGRAELEAVAARCNRRIAETNDYAGVTLGHTPDPGQQGARDPELVGLAGPFRVDRYGRTGKWAIFADLHIFTEDVPKLKKYPRRSPELWLEDDYSEMYLDPIALLGGTAPRLDMGLLLYSAERHGKLVEKYAAVGPTADSVFIAEHSHQPPPEEHSMPLSPEDIQALVNALEETDWLKWVRRQMEADSGIGTGHASEKFAEAEHTPQTTTTTTMAPEPPPAAEDRKEAEKYAKLTQEVVAAQRELAALRNQLEVERAHRVDAERYSRLYELRQRYAFDLDDELARCKYGRMTDEQFNEHCDVIERYFARIPVGEVLPVYTPDAVAGAAQSQATKEKYRKDLATKALEICERKLARGERADYAEELAKLEAK